MAFSDLCKITNAFKTVENDSDQSERIMEENSMVRDLITKILDETGPTETLSSTNTKPLSAMPTQYQKPNSTFTTPFYQDPSPPFFKQNNNYNYTQNGFGNGYYENDSLIGLDPVTNESVTTEQLNLLRLAAQEIGGAQFSNPGKFDYNFFEANQRQSLPDASAFQNFNRPNFNTDYSTSFDNFNGNRYQNGFKENPEQDLLAYLSNLNLNDRPREEGMMPMDFKMPDLNGYHNEEERKMYNFNRTFQPPPKFNGANYPSEKNFPQQPFDYQNHNFKPNGFNQELMRSQMPNYPTDRPFDGPMNRDSMQAAMRQNEIARQMAVMMRNRPPPNQLNVDVSFLHENAPFNLGLSTLLATNTQVPPPALPTPMMDLPLLAPFHTMRNARAPTSTAALLHTRLDACHEQWRQLERERKRTEARLALAFPGRCVSSANCLPVPRLPAGPSRLDRLTVDMLREHTKVLTLMGKMETLRASVCGVQRKPRPDDAKITVLKRGQENLAETKEGLDPETFDPSSWKSDLKSLAEIAPHPEVEAAMLGWRDAVCGVQAARRRELAQDADRPHSLSQLAAAVKRLAWHARRARCAMWADLTRTVALAPGNDETDKAQTASAQNKQNATETASQPAAKTSTDAKEEKPSDAAKAELKPDPKPKPQDKQDKTQKRAQSYRHKVQGRDFYQKNNRYDNRFMPNRHPYHYLATGPIN